MNKKILLITFIIFLNFGCSKINDKIPQNENAKSNEIKKENPFFKGEQKEKFEKKFIREKEFNLPGFLCYNETLTNSGTNIIIETKNCKNEKNENTIYFKIENDILYKIINGSEKFEILKLYRNNQSINKFIENNIINKFKNNLERISCAPIAIKNTKTKNKDFKYLFSIHPIGLYKQTSDKQIKKDSTSIICEGFYNPGNKFIITNYKKDILIEIMNESKIIDLNKIKINVK